MRWLALFLSLLMPVVANSAPDETEDQVIVVPKNPTDADIGVKSAAIKAIRFRVNAALAGRPDGSKARVVVRSIFVDPPSAGQSGAPGVVAFPYAVVPVNAAGQPDGLEMFFRVGLNSPAQAMRTLPWQNGKRDGDEQVFQDEKLQAVIPWVNDQVHGVRRTFHANGKLLAEAGYAHGEPEGPSRNYDPDGHLVSEVTMKAGKRHGIAKDFWPENGQLKREIHYDLGRVVGVTKEFYANGKLKREVSFKNNTLHGCETVYEVDGQISNRRYWLDGEPVSQAEFEQKSKP